MIGVIGGSGLTHLNSITVASSFSPKTPWGNPSTPLVRGNVGETELVFLARHGNPHQIPPHLINYRANIAALKQAGVSKIIAINAVGGIHSQMGPTQIAIPDQIIDYTYDREHTIYDGGSGELQHIDFTHPYSDLLRRHLKIAAENSRISILDGGTYGATQGPRLETAAEILKFKRDGCDVIGMTGMPEAALAREFEIDYACLALSVNWCAGIEETLISLADIQKAIEVGMKKVHTILEEFISLS